jgi:hypothetical protein
MKKSMKIVKTFILIAVVGLLLNVAPTGASSPNKQNVVGMLVITEDGAGKSVQVTMDEAQIAALKKNIDDFEGWLKSTNPLSDLKFSESETYQIKEYVDKILKNLPEEMQFITADEIINLVTPVCIDGSWWTNLFIRHSIISVGNFGRSRIPLSGGDEWAIGMLFGLRIRTFYGTLLGAPNEGGFTTFIRLVPPDVGCEVFSGRHFVTVRSLTGLYLDIGDLGWNTIQPGRVVILGRAYVNAIQI